jgi:acyl carrier protein
MSTSETSAAVAAPTSEAALVDELRELLVELSEGKLPEAAAIEPAGNLFDYGYVDSLTAVEFLARIEERYGVRIDDMDLIERYANVEAIAALLAGSA